MTFRLPKGSKLLDPAFIFGVSTSAFQIEGGTKVDDRLPSIWDEFCLKPGAVKNKDNGDIACNHLQLWESDVDLIESLNVDAYRFSIAWPRVMKLDGTVNLSGVDFYKALVEKLLEKNIRPCITLYHWDLPQYLEDKGGWLNRDTCYRFRDYAAEFIAHMPNEIFSYATLNEPFCSAILGYEKAIHAPGKSAPGMDGKRMGKYAAHHLLYAHGLTMSVLNDLSPNSLNGIVVNVGQYDSIDQNEQNIKATQLAHEENNLWYIEPILKGQYPEFVLEQYPDLLPQNYDEDMSTIAHPIDFLGLNYYTRQLVRFNEKEKYESVKNPSSKHTSMGWEIYPEGLTSVLTTLNQRYELPPIYITENGAAFDDKIETDTIDDVNRVDYFQSHLNALDVAIQNGVKVDGYFAWSLMDNFEWAEGYEQRFGLVYVNFETLERTKKSSALAFQQFLANRKGA